MIIPPCTGSVKNAILILEYLVYKYLVKNINIKSTISDKLYRTQFSSKTQICISDFSSTKPELEFSKLLESKF